MKWERAQKEARAPRDELAAKLKKPADFDTRRASRAASPSASRGFFARDEPIAGLGMAPAVAAARSR